MFNFFSFTRASFSFHAGSGRTTRLRPHPRPRHIHIRQDVCDISFVDRVQQPLLSFICIAPPLTPTDSRAAHELKPQQHPQLPLYPSKPIATGRNRVTRRLTNACVAAHRSTARSLPPRLGGEDDVVDGDAARRVDRGRRRQRSVSLDQYSCTPLSLGVKKKKKNAVRTRLTRERPSLGVSCREK